MKCAHVCLTAVLAATLLMTAGSQAAFAKDNEAGTSVGEVDEIIVLGRQTKPGNRAMQAFNSGDFETAEIEFEKHYTILRRADRALANTAFDSAASLLTTRIAQGPGEVGTTGIASAGGPVSVKAAPRYTNGAVAKTNPDYDALSKDGVVNYKDRSFAHYMTGLSRIQLGKFDLAEKSLARAVTEYGKNYDARMRLGLLQLRAGNYEGARKQLIALNKMRKSCAQQCDDADGLKESTVTLAKALAG